MARAADAELEKSEGRHRSRRRPREQLEPCMRDQCVKTVATTKSHIVASIRTPATARNVELAVIVIFTARISWKRTERQR